MVCVCMYVCMCTYVYMYVYIYVYLYMCIYICVPCCHNQPKVGNDFLELVSSSDAEEKELSSKSKIVCL